MNPTEEAFRHVFDNMAEAMKPVAVSMQDMATRIGQVAFPRIDASAFNAAVAQARNRDEYRRRADVVKRIPRRPRPDPHKCLWCDETQENCDEYQCCDRCSPDSHMSVRCNVLRTTSKNSPPCQLPQGHAGSHWAQRSDQYNLHPFWMNEPCGDEYTAHDRNGRRCCLPRGHQTGHTDRQLDGFGQIPRGALVWVH